jgi:hypothetical protein
MKPLFQALEVLALLAAPALAASNLLVNGDFEGGDVSGWYSQGVGATNAEAHGGVWAARFVNGASCEQTFATVSGRAYKVTAWLRIVSETGTDWGGFSLSATDYASWQTLQNSPYLTAAGYGTNWFKHAFTFTAIGDASRLGLGYFGGNGRQMTVLGDDLGVFDRTASNSPPVVSFLLSPTAFTSLPATQTFAVAGDDPDGAISLVEWVFGDGAISLDPAGARRVGVPGGFSARVRVADDDHGVVETTLTWTATSPDRPSILITNVIADATATVQGIASGTGLVVRLSTDRDFVATATGTTNWSAQLPLRPGWNRILAQAHSGGFIATDEDVIRYVPSGALTLTTPTPHDPTVPRWDPVEVTFDLLHSAATHPQFPYETNLPRGVDFVDGVTVDAVFSPDGGATEYRAPAFLHQRYRIEEKDNYEWMTPTGSPVWTARFAPPMDGTWSVRAEAVEARGGAVSPTAFFTVIPPTNELNHGPCAVSTNDWRFYEFADGTPFLGNGFGLGSFDRHRFSFDAVEKFDAIGAGNATYFRFWAPGLVWGNSWQPWSSRTRGAEGTVPATMLSLDSAYGDALGALMLDVRPSDWMDPAFNPLAFQGFNGESASLEPGTTYRIRVRWRTENLTGPDAPGPFGVTVKFTGWPEPGQTTNEPAIVAHVHGDSPWHVAWGDFVADRKVARNLVIALENVTGGRAFVDECAVHEVLADGSLGPAVNGLPKFAGHLHFNPRRGAAMDVIYREAQARGLYLRMVTNEKQEWSLNHLAPSGLRDPHGGHFNEYGDDAPTVRLHEWHGRHLAARFGAFRSLHGIEFVNEEAPGPTAHFHLTDRLARWWEAQANPKPVSSSTWFGLAEDAWKAPFATHIHATDFHGYTVGNWLRPDGDPAVLFDSANYYREFSESWYGKGFGKPGHWGECSLFDTNYQEHAQLGADTNGVWLHKWIWARCGAGFVYPTYWTTEAIWSNNLHHLFGNWNRFMSGMPLANSRYADSGATSTAARLRVIGQKDVPAGHAFLWLDNRDHTWKRVADGVPVTGITATVQVPLARTAALYRATWYDTASGLPTATNTVAADAAGTVPLGLTNLLTDTAVRLDLEGESAWDGDGDGLPDQWEASQVSRLEWLDGTGDLDRDGFPDRDEWRAGTSPGDARSLLRIEHLNPSPAGNGTISWQSSTGRTYALHLSSNLQWDASSSLASNHISATPPMNTCTVRTEAAGLHVYRVSVE